MNTPPNGPGSPFGLEDGPWVLPCPDRPLVDEESATVLEGAIEELTIVRSPLMLGDGLAELHAMVSLLAQLRAWIQRFVASARDQDYTWDEIAAQLGVTSATARRGHRSFLEASRRQSIEPVLHLDEQGECGWTRATVSPQELQ